MAPEVSESATLPVPTNLSEPRKTGLKRIRIHMRQRAPLLLELSRSGETRASHPRLCELSSHDVTGFMVSASAL